MTDWTCEGASPLPGVPRVRVVDEDGREVLEGWYICHENRQLAALGSDRLRPGDVDHCVAVDESADWGMPRPLVIKRVTPPHRIEVVDPLPVVDREALLALAEEMQGYADVAASGDGYPYVNAGYLWAYADRIREACGEGS